MPIIDLSKYPKEAQFTVCMALYKMTERVMATESGRAYVEAHEGKTDRKDAADGT